MNHHERPLNGAPAVQTTDRICVVRDGGMWLIGVVRESLESLGENVRGVRHTKTLEPAFELGVQMQQHQQGTIVSHVAQPLMLIPGMSTWKLGADAQIWNIETLGSKMAANLRGAYDRAKDMAAAMRAAASGLTLATSMPRRVQ